MLAITLNRVRFGFAGRADDAADLAAETRIPSVVWLSAWLVLNGWVLWTAVPMLWP